MNREEKVKSLKIPSGKKANEKLVEAWKDVPVGTEVVVTLDQFDKTGPGDKRMKTESPPFMLGGHTACIMLDGISGAYALSRVRKA